VWAYWSKDTGIFNKANKITAEKESVKTDKVVLPAPEVSNVQEKREALPASEIPNAIEEEVVVATSEALDNVSQQDIEGQWDGPLTALSTQIFDDSIPEDSFALSFELSKRQ